MFAIVAFTATAVNARSSNNCITYHCITWPGYGDCTEATVLSATPHTTAVQQVATYAGRSISVAQVVIAGSVAIATPELIASVSRISLRGASVPFSHWATIGFWFASL